MLMPQSGEQRKTLALMGSLCLFLSLIEYLIPKPLPFMRIGLANLPLLLALDILRRRDFFLLALLKVLGQGLLGGTLFSYVFFFSLAGTFSSAALMYSLRSLLGKKYLGFAGLGCAGALASNGVQLLLAHYFVFGAALRYLMPPFLASGFVTGIALGVFCEYFCRRSRWYESHARYACTQDTSPANPAMYTHPYTHSGTQYSTQATETIPPQKPRRLRQRLRQRLQRSQRWNTLFRADELFCAGLFMALLFLLNDSIPGRAAQFLFFCLLAWFAGKKNNIFITILIMAGIIFINLLAPYGKVIAVIGPLRITRGSLLNGLEKALTLEGLIMLSRACIKSDLRLPGTIGALLGESLRLLELMRERIGTIRRGQVIAGIDRLMLEMEAAPAAAPEAAEHGKAQRIWKRIVLLGAIVLVTAAMGVML